MVVEKFPIYGVKISGKYICESKNLICSFAHVPSKTLPKIFIITLPPPLRQKEITHSSQTAFFEDQFFPQ